MKNEIVEHVLTDGSIVYSVRVTSFSNLAGERSITLDCNDKNDAEVLSTHIAARVSDFNTHN